MNENVKLTLIHVEFDFISMIVFWFRFTLKNKCVVNQGWILWYAELVAVVVRINVTFSYLFVAFCFVLFSFLFRKGWWLSLHCIHCSTVHSLCVGVLETSLNCFYCRRVFCVLCFFIFLFVLIFTSFSSVIANNIIGFF